MTSAGARLVERPPATIAITTRNRRDELMRLLESCRAQTYRPLEILVYDDASSDGTAAAVAARFPEVRLQRVPSHVGLIGLRSRGLREAQGKYVFSIDDDAYFTDPDTILETVAQFEANDAIAAVAIPFLQPSGGCPGATQPPEPGTPLRSFAGGVAALRREAVLAVGGYRDFLVYGGEEADLSIRLLDRGFTIVYGASCPIVHLPSAVRPRFVADYYPTRNTLLFNWLNVPLRYLFPKLLWDTGRLCLHDLRPWILPLRMVAVLAGLCSGIKYARLRHPVAPATFRRFISLPSHLYQPIEPGATPPAPLAVSSALAAATAIEPAREERGPAR